MTSNPPSEASSSPPSNQVDNIEYVKQPDTCKDGPQMLVRVIAASFDPPTLSVSNPRGTSPTDTVNLRLTLLLTGSASPVTLYRPGSFLGAQSTCYRNPLILHQVYHVIPSTSDTKLPVSELCILPGSFDETRTHIRDPDADLLTLHPDTPLQTSVAVLATSRDNVTCLCAVAMQRFEPGERYKLRVQRYHVKFCVQCTTEDFYKERTLRRPNLTGRVRFSMEQRPEILIEP